MTIVITQCPECGSLYEREIKNPVPCKECGLVLENDADSKSQRSGKE